MLGSCDGSLGCCLLPRSKLISCGHAGALAGAVAILATATVMLAVGKTNNQQMESQEYVRYPLQVHAHGNGPRGAMLRPNGSLSATA